MYCKAPARLDYTRLKKYTRNPNPKSTSHTLNSSNFIIFACQRSSDTRLYSPSNSYLRDLHTIHYPRRSAPVSLSEWKPTAVKTTYSPYAIGITGGSCIAPYHLSLVYSSPLHWLAWECRCATSRRRITHSPRRGMQSASREKECAHAHIRRFPESYLLLGYYNANCITRRRPSERRNFNPPRARERKHTRVRDQNCKARGRVWSRGWWRWLALCGEQVFLFFSVFLQESSTNFLDRERDRVVDRVYRGERREEPSRFSSEYQSCGGEYIYGILGCAIGGAMVCGFWWEMEHRKVFMLRYGEKAMSWVGRCDYSCFVKSVDFCRMLKAAVIGQNFN